MESGLTFNQLICEFESRHPRQNISDCRLPNSDLEIVTTQLGSIGNRKSAMFLWAVAQMRRAPAL